MATRTIVTSQPDVACDVCERRLLRGEQPDVFIVAGRRRIVCELCAPRAAHEGWMRESESQSVSLPPLRPRRGRSFLDRLRQVGRGVPGAADQGETELAGGEADGPYDFLDAPAGIKAAPVAATPRRNGRSAPVPAERDDSSAVAAQHAGEAAQDAGEPVRAGVAAPAGESYVEQALDVFNASEFPRRMAGVARSLGTPEVSAYSAEHLASVVRIVIAWELCWYRYEVDLSDGPAQARLLEQGTELAQLPREERLANGVVADSGALALSGA